VAWEIEYTDEFEAWWNGLTEDEQDKIDVSILALSDRGPHLDFPHSSGVSSSNYPHMRELRVQVGGRPFRVLYAFNPLRTAILLIGGDKTGDSRWYEVNVPLADKLYARHLEELRREGKYGKELQ